ncbi:MAG TPA: hypothetical protein VFX59_28845 [Polyangiales bacterium]|nr:hypothetical protein [Polyangiales bacterium]
MKMRCALALTLAMFGCGDDDGGNPKPTGPDARDAGLDAAPRPADAAPLDAKVDAAPPPFTNAFAVRGKLISAPGDKRSKATLDATVEHTVTHVMAVNPASANPVRYLQPVAADGTFAIGVDLNLPWVIVLVDSRAVGREMVVGIFRSSAFGLDSIAATRAGSLELGDVTVDSAGTASASVTSGNLLGALGLSEAAATLLGELDDISLRYVNPDIDGNGQIDLLEGVSYALDFHLRFNMRDATSDIGLDDLLNQFADPTTTRATYTSGSAIAIWERNKFGALTADNYRIRFPTASGTYTAPPSGGSYSANVWIDDNAAFYTSAGTDTLGISFDATQPFPVGEYDFEVKTTQLSFTSVRTHTLEELNAGDNLIVPFLKLNTSVPGCTGWSCAITGFDYQWMLKLDAGWRPATLAEIALLIPQQGGFISFQLAGNVNKGLGYTIPGSAVQGTIPVTANIPGSTVTPAELSALTVDQICHLGISYDDTLGMRIFQGWAQAPACNPAPIP